MGNKNNNKSSIVSSSKKKNKNILTPSSSTLLGAKEASMETEDEANKVISVSGEEEELIHWPTEDSQSRSLAEKEFYAYLLNNIMPFDIPNAHTLGFSASDVSFTYYTEEAQTKSGGSSTTLYSRRTDRTVTATKSKVQVPLPLPDGLSNGIIEPTIQIALDAKSNPKFKSWTKDIPKSIYFEYVLPYAVLNEARTNWRSLMNETLYEHVVVVEGNDDDKSSNNSVEDVVQKINQVLWGAFYSNNQSDNNINKKKSIHFKAGQTPLIYDPMSIILFGYASCTGLSIMLVDALRTFGIPARLVGTNAWNGKVENGNHSWVEFYSPSQQEGGEGKWVFLEPIVGYDPEKYNPCDFWFCNKEKFDGKTQVFAARFDRSSSESSIHFPIAWDNINMDVIGEDRSEYYNQICSQC